MADTALITGLALVVVWRLFSRLWVPRGGLAGLSRQLEVLPEGAREEARRAWAMRLTLIQTAVATALIAMLALAEVYRGNGETWRQDIPALAAMALMPVAVFFAGMFTYRRMARRV